MRLILLSTVFAAFSLAQAAMPAAAAVRYPDEGGTMSDLGIDVSEVPLNAKDVHAFISGLEPETQAVIMGTCEHYVQNPLAAKSINTRNFCDVAVGAPPAAASRISTAPAPAPQTRTFSSVAPPFVTGPAGVDRWPDEPAGACHYTLDPTDECYWN